MSVETQPKETKAQRAERLKSVKNPWECLDEIRNFASRGYSSIPDEWIKTYFRWWGVYTQGDGVGAVGGTGGEGKALPYFMVRIRLSGNQRCGLYSGGAWKRSRLLATRGRRTFHRPPSGGAPECFYSLGSGAACP